MSGQQLLHNFPRIAKALGKLRVAPNEIIVKVPCLAVVLFVNVGDVPFIGCQQDFALVVEYNLDGLVAQAEQNRVLSANPLFDEDRVSFIS